MFWADRLAQEVEERFGRTTPILVRDEKTASGRVHIGSMRGVAIHGSVAEALAERGIKTEFRYEINDFDPMDDIPAYLPREQFEKYLGVPLCNIPSPEGTAKNFAEYFGGEFSEVIDDAGWHPNFTRASELYLSGKMNDCIRGALEHASDIRAIYLEVSGARRHESWLPIQIVCPQCGKISTTVATDFDGQTVQYVCKPDAVAWTRGCGAEGRLSPFDGNAKLPWKVDWAAKWKVNGVNVEGAGKDHSTKGGSRDVANLISKEVFGYAPPFDVPYEFFLVGGRKMSSSKGRGSSAKDISELLPPQMFRFALLSKDINQAISFDPEGDTIPVLYDLYDQYAEQYRSGADDDYARLFSYAHPAAQRANIVVPFLPRFSQVAFLVQMPHLDLEQEVARLKGETLDGDDKKELAERAEYARRWLSLHAPEKYRFALQDTLPEAAQALLPIQKEALVAIAKYVEGEEMLTGEGLHKALHDLKESLGIAPAELFGAIYLSFLGKTHGPKAGWFLSVLPKDFLLKRLYEAAGV